MEWDLRRHTESERDWLQRREKNEKNEYHERIEYVSDCIIEDAIQFSIVNENARVHTNIWSSMYGH